MLNKMKFGKSLLSNLVCGVSVPMVAFSAPAWAQAVPQAASDYAAEDIIVTAQRRSERLEDVPMSVVATDSAKLEKAGIVNIHDLDQLAPGVQVGFAGAFTQPAIRGVTTLTTGSGFENNVAVYVDGFYSPDTVTINSDLVNISDVQIFKGPQGTLYGRNATGGAILINTLAPSDTFTARGHVSYARYNEVSVGAYISGPLSESLRVGVAGSYRDGDGYYKYIDPSGNGRLFGHATPIRQESVRGKIEADLSEKITATIGLNYGYSNDPRGLIFTSTGYSPPTRPGPPFSATAPFTASTNMPTENKAKVKEATAKLAFDLGIGTLTSYTGYARRDSVYQYDFDATYTQILESFADFKQDTFQQTLDLSAKPVDRLDLVLGASYFKDHLTNQGTVNFFLGNQVDLTKSNLKTDSWAIYGDGTYQLSDKLFFGVGARYTREKKHIDYRQTDPSGTIDFVVPASKNAHFSAFTPRATLRYELEPRTSLYATISRGFRSGGFQPTPVPDPSLLIPFKPEKITAYEIGFKTAQHLFRFDIAAYYYDYRNLQVGVTVANPVNNSLINFVSNAKKAEIYGVDLQGSVTPTDGLTLRAGLAYTHGRYKVFPNATANGLDASTGLNVGQVQDWAGLRMARAPDISGNGGFDYETALAGGTFNTSLSGSFTSKYPQSNPSLFGPLAGALARKQRYNNSGYVQVNGQIAWTDPSDRYTVTLFGTNLSNAKYFLNYNGTSLFGDLGVYNQPRSYGVKFSFKY